MKDNNFLDDIEKDIDGIDFNKLEKENKLKYNLPDYLNSDINSEYFLKNPYQYEVKKIFIKDTIDKYIDEILNLYRRNLEFNNGEYDISKLKITCMKCGSTYDGLILCERCYPDFRYDGRPYTIETHRSIFYCNICGERMCINNGELIHIVLNKNMLHNLKEI